MDITENKRFQESGGIEIRKGEEKQTKEKVTPNFANREEYEKWKKKQKSPWFF